jgi:hypothetical protein
MEVYKNETQEILNRFMSHRLKFLDCIAALDSALAALIPILRPEDLLALRRVILSNNETVMKEMERRERKRKINAKSRRKIKAANYQNSRSFEEWSQAL